MGDHYIPRHYLKGFTEEGQNSVWVYDKIETKTFRASTEKVAQEIGFYSRKVEEYLANKIESPANAVIKKVRERQLVAPDEKLLLSKYMMVMYKRVPAGKQKFREMAPGVADSLMKRYGEALDDMMLSDGVDVALIARRRKDIEEILAQFASAPPEGIWLDILNPEQTPRSVEAMARMTWCFFTRDQDPLFLSSDNPVFFPSSMGLGHRDSELCFPLSSTVALWGTWRKDLKESYIPADSQVAKELNRRTASKASRYVFHCKNETWVMPFIKKKGYSLNRIT
jgi:hypothetical protein